MEEGTCVGVCTCVSIRASEGGQQVSAEADLTQTCPTGWAAWLRRLRDGPACQLSERDRVD